MACTTVPKSAAVPSIASPAVQNHAPMTIIPNEAMSDATSNQRRAPVMSSITSSQRVITNHVIPTARPPR